MREKCFANRKEGKRCVCFCELYRVSKQVLNTQWDKSQNVPTQIFRFDSLNFGAKTKFFLTRVKHLNFRAQIFKSSEHHTLLTQLCRITQLKSSKSPFFKARTSQLISMNFLSSYHPTPKFQRSQHLTYLTHFQPDFPT